jgi:hypothetical protein
VSARPMIETLLADLDYERGWVCGSSWYATFRPTFAQRISEWNKVHPGAVLSRPCHRKEHQHKRSGIHEYALAKYAWAEQRRLIA